MSIDANMLGRFILLLGMLLSFHISTVAQDTLNYGSVDSQVLQAVLRIDIVDSVWHTTIDTTGMEKIKRDSFDVKHQVGTGFLVSKKMDGKEGRFQFLVTNKHLIGQWELGDRKFSKFYKQLKITFYLDESVSRARYTKATLSISEDGTRLASFVLPHPDPQVDIVIIDLLKAKFDGPEPKGLKWASFDTSYLVRFDKIHPNYKTGMGDKVLALGYPYGINSSLDSYPICKFGHIAAFPGEELEFNISKKDKDGKVIGPAKIKGKFLLVDDLMVGGNSGGPLVLPRGTKVIAQGDNSTFTFVTTKNKVLGIVSSRFPGANLSIIMSSDYILDLIEIYLGK